jgi:sugar/nucleoside kinase (ribokinase family)
MLEWCAAKAVPQSAVTRGARSIMGSSHGSAFEIEVENIDACDTSGAGDVLHGAFCFHFARTREFEASLRLASQIATQSCRGLGTQNWINKNAHEHP